MADTSENLPGWLEQRLEVQRRVGRHVNPRHFLLWFMGLAILFTLAMSALMSWHNRVVNPVRPQHLLLRGAILFAGYLVIMAVIYWKVFRPAFLKAHEEARSAIDQGENLHE